MPVEVSAMTDHGAPCAERAPFVKSPDRPELGKAPEISTAPPRIAVKALASLLSLPALGSVPPLDNEKLA